MASTYDPNAFEPLQFHTKLASFQAGQDSPRDYLEQCLDTIALKEPALHAWVVLNEQGAREQADASAARWRSGRPLSQIDGMPIGIKDLLETRDMPTQMGCAAYAGNFPKRDNAAVWALRQAGAVILGKTATTELGGPHPGPTVNPFDPAHTPGGSSSGSAAAVGARMVPAAIGTQVGGSIIRPASYCGNYALKPSQGAINRGERQATSMSTHGPHAGSLEDMWAVAIEIAIRAGGDPGSPALAGPMQLPTAHAPAVLAVLETEGWAGLAPEAKLAFEQVISQIERTGVKVVRRTQWPELDHFERMLDGVNTMAGTMTAWENHWALRNLLALDEESVSPRGRAGLKTAERLGVQGYRDLIEKRRLIRHYHAILATGADAMISPASPGPAPVWSGDVPGQPLASRPTGDATFNTPSSLLGVPVVTSPLTRIGNLPMGIQLMGWPGTDAKVTAIARWLRDHVRPVCIP